MKESFRTSWSVGENETMIEEKKAAALTQVFTLQVCVIVLAESLAFSHTDLMPIATPAHQPTVNAPIAAVRSLNNTIQPTVSGNNLPDERASECDARGAARLAREGRKGRLWAEEEVGAAGGVQRSQLTADFGIVALSRVGQQVRRAKAGSDPSRFHPAAFCPERRRII